MGFCGRVWCNYHDPIGLLTMPIVLKGKGAVMVGLSPDWVRRCLHGLRRRVLCVRLDGGRHPPVFDRSLLYLHGCVVWSQGHLYRSRTRRRPDRIVSEVFLRPDCFRRGKEVLQAGRILQLLCVGFQADFFSRKCDCMKPARAHHCSKCGVCILKMDHHCP